MRANHSAAGIHLFGHHVLPTGIPSECTADDFSGCQTAKAASNVCRVAGLVLSSRVIIIAQEFSTARYC